MLPNSTLSTEKKVSPFDGALKYSVPGKVFLLGEYAVLAGMPAIVASVGPRFRISVVAADEPAERPFHPRSPASRLVDWAMSMRAQDLTFAFEDEGSGGFGASTAQFALAYRAYADSEKWSENGKDSWERVWNLYRELTPPSRGLPPSGADLVAQWNGSVILFDPTGRKVEDVWSRLDWNSLLVFSASGQPGRKVATHEHLEALNDPAKLATIARKLGAPLRDGIRAVRDGALAKLGLAFDQYAECLRDLHLEIPATREDLAAIRPLAGVLGAKGAGALQADSIVVVMDPAAGEKAREAVIAKARSRGLELVANGLERQGGVSCLN